MLQRCRITGAPGVHFGRGDAPEKPPLSVSSPIGPSSEQEWKPFDLIQKRSGPHNLSRAGYEEEKCRNVLVRFCAHVPRNFQYKDGIQQIFLILRDHLGDENLDLAGGVLYELIEVDCEHTDDPGAAFQRWRHDHMYRYADLELPHIPHMTTITSSIIPTERLSRWRAEHADRYRFVLSDSSPMTKRECTDPSCIRNRKAWLIDHTLFVSTKFEGTRSMRTPNPKEFHEMQWSIDHGTPGKLVDERELPIPLSGRPSKTSLSETVDVVACPKSRSQRLRHSLSIISIIEKFAKRLGKHKRSEVEKRRRSWVSNSLIADSSSLSKDRQDHCGITSVPWPEGYQIPNAIFARKFLIVDQGEILPSNLPISQMPTAESKATETILEAAHTGLLNQTSSWLFRGPFTPQLGFDGGLDYQWSIYDPSITVKRFDLKTSSMNTPKPASNLALSGTDMQLHNSHVPSLRSLSKRTGRVFDTESAAELKSCASAHDAIGGASSLKATDELLLCHSPHSSVHTCNHTDTSPTKTTCAFKNFTLDRHENQDWDWPLFKNVKFTVQAEPNNTCTSVDNRQTTIIERSDQGNIVHDIPACQTRKTYNDTDGSQATPLYGLQASNSSESKGKSVQVNSQELLLSNLQPNAHTRQVNVSNSRQVPRTVTGELLQPLRYNASGGRKRGEGKNVTCRRYDGLKTKQTTI